MRPIDADALKEVLKECAYSNDGVNTWILKDEVLGMIDNAPIVSDRYDEGYAQGYIDGSTGADWKGGAE